MDDLLTADEHLLYYERALAEVQQYVEEKSGLNANWARLDWQNSELHEHFREQETEMFKLRRECNCLSSSRDEIEMFLQEREKDLVELTKALHSSQC